VSQVRILLGAPTRVRASASALGGEAQIIAEFGDDRITIGWQSVATRAESFAFLQAANLRS
jgi:hypothetical protein